MNLKKRLNQLCQGDIEIENFNLENMQVDVLLPYESGAVSIELEGKDDDEIIESFKREVNSRLNDMIYHLNDCKFDE